MDKLQRHHNKILLFGIILIFTFGCASTINQKYFTKTLGLNIEMKKKIFSSEDAINPQGEGFSIEVIAFERKDDDSLFVDEANYPKSYDLRKDWKVTTWKRTPFQNKNVLELMFSYKIDNVKMKEQLESIKQILKSDDNYISYYYKDNDGEIYAIDVCIVDVKKKKIYLCEIIT